MFMGGVGGGSMARALTALIAAVVMAWLGAPGASAAGWRLDRVAGGRSGYVAAVSCGPAGQCAAVGGANQVGPFVAQASGRRWTVRARFKRAAEAIWCGIARCVAVGTGPYAPQPYAEQGTGSRWRFERMGPPSTPPNSAPAPYGSHLFGVSCATPSDCFAVGGASVYTTLDCPPDPVIRLCITQATMIEHYDGKRWSGLTVPLPVIVTEALPRPGNGPFIEFDSVSCSARDACMVIGSWGTLGVSGGHVFADRWNGRRWRVEPIPSLPDSGLSSVSCTGPAACTAVGTWGAGGAHALAERWNGRRWRLQSAVAPARRVIAGLSSVSCSGARSCVAVGNVLAKHGGRRPLAERWNGARWTLERLPKLPRSDRRGAALVSVSCSDASVGACVAVGNDNRGWFAERYS
jgi:hypothetical protein